MTESSGRHQVMPGPMRPQAWNDAVADAPCDLGNPDAGASRFVFMFRSAGTTIQASWYYLSMKTISLKLPDDIDAKLELRASTLGMTKSEITREALSRHLEGAPTPGVSCLDLVRDLVGTARGPGDLASNKKHLRGYGR